MNSREYFEGVLKTESSDFTTIRKRLENGGPKTLRILHACMGLNTEVGEISDQLKKHIFYGKPLDEVNLMEELGDLFWYAALLSMAIEFNFEEIWKRNLAKLKARYGDKFAEDKATTRDLNTERDVLEGK